ncbi:unnamed protein product [Sphagnum jensenii]|uniref:FAS1 domain-containing protein n=1 Tax=Sphagnum jensenii TaxID=128206 RepID=A0ABP0W737_9BRYO
MAKLLLCGNYMLTSVLLCFLISASLLIGAPAYLLGIPTPTPYRLLAGQSIAHGVNFANAGSGVTYTFGTTPLGAEVHNFELFLRKDPYSKVALANSLTLVGVDGDDYVTFNGNFSTESLVYINRVVTGVGINLQRLYDMGLRDVMVTNILPPRCDPHNTKQSNYTICDTAADTLAEIHNELLLGVVEKINARNPGARFIILNQYAAFSQLYEQTQAHIGLTDGLVPCCIGLGNSSCGDTDPTGQPLYTLCKHRDMSLAIGELQQALNSILANVNYSESLGLLEGVDVAALLGQLPAGNVTVFLPDNQACLNAHLKVMDGIFSNDLVNAVALYHVVDSFLDYNTLLLSHPSNLTTFSSHLQLPVSFQPQGIFIGHGSEAAQVEASAAQIVRPNLYVVPGKIAVYGVNNLLFPPNIMYTN